MVEGRVDPHKKAHFTLHISDAIADGEVGDYTSVKCNACPMSLPAFRPVPLATSALLTQPLPDNHKPAQTTSKRSTALTPASANSYRLTLEDDKADDNKDVFVFTGQKTVPKKSYILLFDPTAQKATLEPLSATYTFNIASKNGSDISSTHSKIYPRKQKDDAPDEPAADDLFGGDVDDNGDGDPDANNPFDFRHFMNAENAKAGNDSEYAFASSPDYRTGTGSAMNTPQVTARKPTAASSKPKAPPQAAAKPKKRKSPEPERAPPKKPAPKKQAAPPTVRLERRATDNKTARKPAPPPSSKIKSSEIVHSSDESDADAEPDNAPSSPARRSPSPPHRHTSPESDEDEDMEDVGIGASQPSQPRTGALASLGLGQTIGQGYLNSPTGGPISLASAASSAQGSPDPHKGRTRHHADDGVIDFGDLGGAAGSEDEEDDAEDDVMHDVEEDRDVDSIHLGSPAQRTTHDGMEGEADGDGEVDEEEEDPLLKEMMEGLAGGDSSEESEEE
jgi:hypothetical protein